MGVRVQCIAPINTYVFPGKGSVGAWLKPGQIHYFEESYEVAKGLFDYENRGLIQIIDKDFVLRTVIPDLGDAAFTLDFNFVIDATHLTNKYITVAEPILYPETLNVDISGAPDVNLNTDYRIQDATKIAWDGMGLDGLLTIGDKVRVTYRDPNS